MRKLSCGQRAWPFIRHFQCTLLTGKREARQNADVAILLSTPWAFHILSHSSRKPRKSIVLAAKGSLESCMQLVEMV